MQKVAWISISLQIAWGFQYQVLWPLFPVVGFVEQIYFSWAHSRKITTLVQISNGNLAKIQKKKKTLPLNRIFVKLKVPI